MMCSFSNPTAGSLGAYVACVNIVYTQKSKERAMPANNKTIAGMARSYNTRCLGAHIESHSGEINTPSRSFFNWSRSIEDQGAGDKGQGARGKT
jgi:hypothetical protein